MERHKKGKIITKYEECHVEMSKCHSKIKLIFTGNTTYGLKIKQKGYNHSIIVQLVQGFIFVSMDSCILSVTHKLIRMTECSCSFVQNKS